jgi:DNA-binding beta-propeller fold protein YncE
MFVRDTETGILSALGTPTLTTNDPEGLAISPDGLSVYVVNEGDNTVSMYSRDKASGLLTPMSTATIATGSRPTKIAISSDGKSVYVLNGLSGNISMYDRDTTTGQLTSIGTEAHPYVEPFGISVSNSGDSVYVTDKRSSSITTYIRH